MSYTLTRGSRVQAGEYDALWTPRNSRGSSKAGVILVHGAATPQMFSGNNFWPDLTRLAAALANNDIPCIAPTDTLDYWGNGTHMTRMTSALAQLSALTGCSSSKVHVVGVSMGAGAALRWAALNTSKVASVNLMIPAINYNNLYWGICPTRTNGFTSAIASAWGLTSRALTVSIVNGSNAFTVTTGTLSAADNNAAISLTPYNLSLKVTYVDPTHGTFDSVVGVTATPAAVIYQPPATLSGQNGFDMMGVYAPLVKAASIPGRMFYSTADQFITPADITGAVTPTGFSAVAVDTTSGHANGTAANWRGYGGGTEFSDLVAYLKLNGA